MRLNSALVSSFLFGAIVLGDDHPKKHPRRFINTVDKNLNVTLPLDWAGASLFGGGKGCLFRTGDFKSVSGSFAVPLAWGSNSGKGVSVALAIGGIAGACTDTATNFWTGIDVLLTGNNVSYSAWAAWGNQVQRSTNFDIAPADFIQASLTLNSRKSGVALLKNLSNNQTWEGNFTTDNDVVCRSSAEWVVTPLRNFSSTVVPISNFSTVGFLNSTAGCLNGTTVTADGGRINNLDHIDGELTNVMTKNDLVVVACEL